MKKLTVRILAGVICAIFVIALLFLGLSISSENKKGINEAELNFESISVYTKSLCAFYEPESKEFMDALKTRLSTEKQYYMLSLVCNGKEIYKEFFPEERPNFSSKEFSADVSSTIGISLTLKAAYATINSESIFESAKISFFLILIGTILAVALLILQTILMNRNGENDDEFDFENIPDEADEDGESTEENDVSYDEEANEEPETYENESDDVVSLSSEEMSIFEEPPASDEYEAKNENSYSSDETDSEISENFENKGDDFETELNEEIANAAALDQDLSVILVQCKDYLNARPIFDNATISIRDSNPSEKLNVFDYKNGFALLLKNADLDKALKVGEDVHSKITKMLKDYGIDTELATGISSRTERMITGSRLIAEAEQACEHGFEDKDNSVVAFRVDPELYKKFLAEQGA